MYKHYCVILSIAFAICTAATVHSQTYTDYFGNGHQVGISVSSSSELGSSKDEKALTGSGLFTDEVGASRFLAQSTMGSNYEGIQDLVSSGIDSWLDNQFSLTPISYEDEYNRIYTEAQEFVTAHDLDRNEYLTFAFYEKLIKQPDALRQKVAFALSQIFVINPIKSQIGNRAYATSHFYDIMYLGAFGNYHDILYDVSLHPLMGAYLSHFQNEKPDIVQGTLPDENYAREIMQLFSIGLHELNLDGSFKTDANGNVIPTYDIEDIQELARVFTGLSGSERLDAIDPQFTHSFGAFDLRLPMAMYNEFHDKREKVLIDNTVLAADQDGLTDIDIAIDKLFNHPNVGPFIGKRMIQHLVKSNPSPQYIFRAASVFNDDGSGVRGNMQAVIRTILTDPEARDCIWINDVTAGKLIQPMERLTNLFLAFDISTPSNKFWFRDNIDILDALEQAFLSSPSVFNFFTPFYAEREYVEANNLVSPEFQILNSTTGINYVNEVETRLKFRPFQNRTKSNSSASGLTQNVADAPVLDFSDEILAYQSGGLDALLDRLNLIICRGQLQPSVESIIKNRLSQNIQTESNYDVTDIIHDAIYFIMISPNYTILK